MGSTALAQLDEVLAHERIRDTFSRFSDTISRYGGNAREIRGDALVAEFARASDAVSVSLAFQSSNFAHIESLTDEIRPTLRVGIAMGEVVVADNTVTGVGVVLAQRLEQLAIAVEPEIGAAERDRARHRSPETVGVWELCQRGFWHYHHSSAPEMPEAHRLFARAREIDPNLRRPSMAAP